MIENDESRAEIHPFVSKGICQYFDWEHRNLDVKVAYSVKEINLKWKLGDTGSRNSYAMN